MSCSSAVPSPRLHIRFVFRGFKVNARSRMDLSSSVENMHFHCCSLVRTKKFGFFSLVWVREMDRPHYEGADLPHTSPLRYRAAAPKRTPRWRFSDENWHLGQKHRFSSPQSKQRGGEKLLLFGGRSSLFFSIGVISEPRKEQNHDSKWNQPCTGVLIPE